MQRNLIENLGTRTSLVNNLASLTEYPHWVHRLIELDMQEWEPTPAQHKSLVDHLTTCLDCQIALGILALMERDYARRSGSPVGPIEQLLSDVTRMIHETAVRNDITAYIELLEAKGEKKASKKYPQFFEHLQQCKACQLAVEETRDLLHRAKEAGLIEP